MYLTELSTPVSHLKGVGPSTLADLKSLGVTMLRDLLLHLPRDYEDRSHRRPLQAAFEGLSVNTVAYVEGHEFFGFGKQKTLKVRIKDESAAAYLVCFGRNFLAQKLLPGMRIYVAGSFSYRFGELQSAAFDFEPWSDDPGRFAAIIPVYPLAGRLTQTLLRKFIGQTIRQYADNLTDELPEELRRRRSLVPESQALRNVHLPQTLSEASDARRTLAYHELFLLQFAAGRRAVERRLSASGKPPDARLIESATALQNKLRARLPFTLTEDQDRVIQSHFASFSEGNRVAMLLQGEVGSGKTLVAFFMSLLYVGAKQQVAFMAPTELLARQHAENAARFLEPIGVRIAFLSGNLKGTARTQLLAALKRGEIDLLVGTHAVFTESVEFKDLRLAVVDEQHRFGVAQRNSLIGKGRNPDTIMMTATPIPRTLALSVFGDLDVQEIRTMPAGRKRVETHLARQGNEQKVYDWVHREIASGHQAYFVYPLIEQSDKLELKDAESMHKELTQVFPGATIGLLHSRVPEDSKHEIMEQFAHGTIDLLVATSVVEVGVDVANATCMVVEHAERFGLAALHQLRGRVGRGPAQAYAFLLYSPELTEEGKQRLKIMLSESDGFRIAEEDLKLRGPGDISGTQQSGYLRLAVADLSRDMELMLEAREDAFTLLESDPGLLSPEHENLRKLEAATFAEES